MAENPPLVTDDFFQILMKNFGTTYHTYPVESLIDLKSFCVIKPAGGPQLEGQMSELEQDIWAEWLLKRRFSGNREQMKAVLSYLYLVRNTVLDHAGLSDGETLLDVGCGDGLIAFGALEKVKTSKVIFSDISQDLLDHARVAADEMQVAGRCSFINASADDLSAIPDASVDVVTTRSVLIYVPAKQKAFDEFYRLLKPSGRLSIFEPINRFGWPEPPQLFSGYDVSPIIEIADKVKALYLRLQPLETDPMLDFDERDLLLFTEKAGFKEIHLELRAEIKPPTELADWDSFLHVAGNPKIPNLEEAIAQTLTPAEADRFIAHLRPLVEGRHGTARSAAAYLWAVKNT
jgi:ubiquinone/menaquinone biosynthesis C-methylase UbiE